MEISSEEEKKTETSLSSNEIRQEAKAGQQMAVIPLVTMKAVLPNN
jgi:hypothetical protein